MSEVIVNRAGRAEEMTLVPIRPLDACGIKQYLLTLPGAHPFWSQFMLGLISLADVPGVPPAHKSYEQAEYEILFVALDPDYHPIPEDRESWHPLIPANYVVQFHGITRDEAMQMLRMLAGEFVAGRLIAEPTGVMGAREMFAKAVERLKWKILAERPMRDI